MFCATVSLFDSILISHILFAGDRSLCLNRSLYYQASFSCSAFCCLIGNIFEAVTVVQDETIQSSRYFYCALIVLISNLYVKHQHSFLFLLGGLVQDHLRTQNFFLETRTAMRRALHLQQQISLPRTTLLL